MAGRSLDDVDETEDEKNPLAFNFERVFDEVLLCLVCVSRVCVSYVCLVCVSRVCVLCVCLVCVCRVCVRQRCQPSFLTHATPLYLIPNSHSSDRHRHLRIFVLWVYILVSRAYTLRT